MMRLAARLLPPLLIAASALQAQNTPSSFDQSDPFASRFREKSRVEIKFRKPEPGGQIKITALSQNCHEELNLCEAEGDVVVEYQDIKIQADKITFDRSKKTAHAQGHVILDQGPSRIAGTRGDFDLDAKTGVMEEAQADLQPDVHIIAKSITKTGEATYDIVDGIFTTCRLPDPPWSFAMKTATITLDDYARMHRVSMRTGKVPVLWVPYLVWPTKEGRVSGFLVPGLGYNSRRGAYLGLTYYWVTGRPTDSTTSVDLFSKSVFGIAEEFRWAPSPQSAGVIQFGILKDPQAEICVPGTATGPNDFCFLPDGTAGVFAARHRTRWKLRLDHASDDLPWDMRGVASIREYSDPYYLTDFERDYSLNSARTVDSTAFLTKNVGDDSLNLRGERAETFFNQQVILERTPSLELAHRPAQIGETPLYAALAASFSRLFIDRGPGLLHGGYWRGDLHPDLSLPIKGIPWFTVTAKAGGDVTTYSDSTAPLALTGDAYEQSFLGESLTRKFWNGGVSSVGPSFSRIYDFALGPFVKWKHVIEPRLDYSFVQNIDHPDEIPLFDEVDSVLGKNALRYALINRLLAKQGGENPPSAQEVASLELSQSYNLTAAQTVTIPGAYNLPIEKLGPATALLRLVPVNEFHFDARLDYDTKFSQATSYTVTAGANWTDQYANVSWSASRPVVNAQTGTPSEQPPGTIPGEPVTSPNSDFLRASAGVNLFSKNWRVDTQLNYDARQSKMIEDRSLLTYNGSCYKILLEVRNYRLPPVRHDYRLVINLKDIGTLFDINGALDKMF